MAPTPAKEIRVLITGYGPFQRVVNNPSWLAVKPLHNRRLDLSKPPGSSSTSAHAVNNDSNSTSSGSAQVHIQCIQLPVHYGSILDTIPRIHGASAPASPDAKLWFDARCDSASGLAGEEGKSFPEGYAVETPPREEGWDVILHVGVGRRGGLECETLAHKTGYRLPDAAGCLPPVVQDTTARAGSVDRPEENEKAIDASLSITDGKVRGFGAGYEPFAQVQKTEIDVEGLLAWLKEHGIEDVTPSTDAGLYLCEFIYYAALSEAERRASELGPGTRKTDVMFLHVPPVGERLDTPTCTAIIERIAWYCARKRL